MGIFSKNKKQESEIEAPIETTGKINGLTPGRGRGFILETGTDQSIFFNSEACADFETLTIGQNVTFKKERDPRDRLRMHAIEVRPA